MAIAFDAASQGASASSTTSISWSHTCTSATMLIVATNTSSAADAATSVTYNGVSLTAITSSQTSTLQCGWIGLWYLANPPSGTNTIVANLPSGGIQGSAVSYVGVWNTGFPDNVAVSNASTGSSYNESITTVADKCWTMLYVVTNQLTNPSPGSGTTSRIVTSTAGRTMLADSNAVIHPAGTSTLNAVGANGFWLSTIISMPTAPVLQTFSVTATGVVGFVANRFYIKAFSEVVTGIASLAKGKLAFATLALTVTGVVSLASSSLLKWTLEQKNALASFLFEPKE